MRRRIGYAERQYAEVVARKKREKRRQTLIAVGVIGMFGTLITFIYYGLYLWANGGM